MLWTAKATVDAEVVHIECVCANDGYAVFSLLISVFEPFSVDGERDAKNVVCTQSFDTEERGVLNSASSKSHLLGIVPKRTFI